MSLWTLVSKPSFAGVFSVKGAPLVSPVERQTQLCRCPRTPSSLNQACSHLLIYDKQLWIPSTSTSLSAIMPESEDNPVPAYQAFKASRFDADPHLYSRIGATTSREMIESFNVPIRSGRAWSVPRGHICRITTPEGPQVGDLNIWNLYNPRERFWASRTRQLHASHVTKFNRLWSCLPYLRPLVTITGDSLEHLGVDEAGGRVHDLLGTRCDPYINQMLSGQGFDYHCHSNLTRAILPYGLTEFDVHDVLNVFQVTGLNSNGEYFMQPCPAKPGDFFEFFAEVDVLCALSTCPGGDLSKWDWAKNDGEDPMLECCRPLGVEVYKITDTEVLNEWEPPATSSYKGLHGIKLHDFS